MADNIHALPGVVISEGKQTFLDTIAKAYDDVASQGKGEPVAVVFAFVAELGNGRTGYHSLSAVSDRNSLYIARAVSMIEHDGIQWDDGSRIDED